jgi:superfamily II DNA/RNA helicase
MRMACDSSFLLDKETDDGFKADELIDLLDELLTDPAAKVVIFSQWLRMHELIVRRLERCGWQYVLFHGGVPGEKRGALVDRFNHDPDCRVFLSTDAGGVGLNLQHAAATVVNMDLPWNPAVLEQRIGRVHRLGQTRGVQVINFVARGTIEESMLSVLAFKKSLADGILDGGDSQVTLQGTRLSKFMETVDQVTGSLSGAAASREDDGHDTPPLAAMDEATLVGEADGVDEYRAAGVQPATAGTGGEAAALHGLDVDAQTGSADAAASTNAASASSEPVSTAPNPWAPLLAAGAQVFGELLAASRGERESSLVHTDPATGERFLKLPVPDPASVQKLAEGLLGLLAGKR